MYCNAFLEKIAFFKNNNWYLGKNSLFESLIYNCIISRGIDTNNEMQMNKIHYVTCTLQVNYI